MSPDHRVSDDRPSRARIAWITVAAVALGVGLHASSLDAGFRGDDYVHAAMLRGQFSAARDRRDLFDFAAGSRADDDTLRDFGYLPWWSAPELRLRMARPLASASIAQEHAWFGLDARPMHVVSLVWLAALLCVASLLLHATLPPTAAAVALFFFAVSNAHVVPIVWLANRSTLIATTLAFACLAAYLRARRRKSAVDAGAAFVFACTALLAGEYALTALAYVLAYELVGRDEPLSRRLRALAPIAAACIAYVLVRAALGVDVSGSGYYLSPTRTPWAFAGAALSRVPVLCADLVLGLPSGYFNSGAPLRDWLLSLSLFSPATWRKLPDWRTIHVALGVLSVAGFAGLVRVALRATSGAERRALACFGLGSALSLLPGAGSLPSSRLLVAASLGACAIAASVSTTALRVAADAPARARIARRLLWGTLLVIFGVWSPLRTYGEARRLRDESQLLRAWALDADLPRDASAPHTRVYVIASADFTTAVNLPWLRLAHGHPLPRSYRRLSPAAAAHDLQRIDDRTLELVVLSANVRGSAVPSLYRDEAHPLHDGDRFALPGLSVHVLRTLAGNPSRMRFVFDRSLDDPSLRFVTATTQGLRAVAPPPVGQSVRLMKPVLRDVRAARTEGDP